MLLLAAISLLHTTHYVGYSMQYALFTKLVVGISLQLAVYCIAEIKLESSIKSMLFCTHSSITIENVK